MIKIKNFDTITVLANARFRSYAIQQGLRQGLGIAKEEVKRNILSGSRSGRPFKLKIGNKLYVGRHSAPSENIANITGQTQRQSYFKVTSNYAILGSKAPYSGYAEHGTKYIAPRNTYKKVVNKNTQMLANKIEQFLLSK